MGAYIINQNASFYQKPQPIQCDPALAIAGAKRVASRERSYHDLGLETIVKRR